MILPIISTRLHGILDYVTGTVMIFFPWIAGYSQYSWSLWTLMIFGIGAILYSLVTRYEFGAAGLISVRTHLVLDLLFGGIVAASPWLLNFSHETWAAHVAFGGFSVLSALITDTKAKRMHGPVLKPEPNTPGKAYS